MISNYTLNIKGAKTSENIQVDHFWAFCTGSVHMTLRSTNFLALMMCTGKTYRRYFLISYSRIYPRIMISGFATSLRCHVNRYGQTCRGFKPKACDFIEVKVGFKTETVQTCSFKMTGSPFAAHNHTYKVCAYPWDYQTLLGVREQRETINIFIYLTFSPFWG